MKKKDEKKNKYSRKPTAITGAGMKAVEEVVEQTVKAGKRLMSKGKLTKAGKDIKVIKALTDPADKAAIKAAKSSANRKEILKKAEDKSFKRAKKEVIKGEGRAKAEIKAKNAEIDIKNAERRQTMERQSSQKALKEKLKGLQASRASQKDFNAKAMEAQKNERRLPEGIKIKPKVDTKPLKPVTSVNAAKKIANDAVTPKVKVKPKPKLSSTRKATAAGLGIAAAVGINEKLKSNAKSKKEDSKVVSKSINDSGREVVQKKLQAAPRNEFNKKVKGEQKITPKATEKKPVGSASEALTKAISSDKIQKKFGGKVPPKLKSEALSKARAEIAKQKKSNVPWEKILESITMMMSSYILSRGISKRYK